MWYSFYTGIQEGTQCTKCKNEWALKTSIALLYVLCTLLTIAVAVLGYKGKTARHCDLAGTITGAQDDTDI